MAEKVVVYWRDIPAQVIVKAGRKTAKRQLSERFEQAIDRAAMRAKLTGTDAYLEQWRRADPVPCGDDLEAEAAAAAEALEAEYTAERLRELVANGGTVATRPDVRRPPLVDPPRRVLGSGSTAASSGPTSRPARCSSAIGFARLEAPAAAVERNVKGLLFDCQMCGKCVLSSTGMSCPMNCPKQMRNGPCGGVRAERALRGQAGDALRLGAGLGRLAPDGARATGSPSCSRRSTIAARAARPGCAVVRERLG